jgi:hypothetical protein
MDYREKIDDIIGKLNSFNHSREEHAILIKEVCDIYDYAVNDDLSSSDISLLYYLSNIIGVPQYFDLLCKIKQIDNSVDFTNILFLSSLLQEAAMHISKETKVHFFQKEVINHYIKDSINRYLISAPTSFGKTFIIYYLIEKLEYSNIALLFPTISLLSENLQRVLLLMKQDFLSKYKLITLSEEEPDLDNNIFIFTPERFMTFVDKNPNQRFDFIFMDEIYKIDNDYMSDDDDEEMTETNRDIAFRIALEMALKKSIDGLLVGPYLNYKDSKTISNFIRDNHYEILDYNDIDLVKKKQISYSKLKKDSFDNIKFKGLKSSSFKEKILDILQKTSKDESIVYCPTRYYTEYYAIKISEKKIYETSDNSRLKLFISHLESNFTRNWCLVKALKNGIGIHHGTIPKYIQREIIKLFNDRVIKCIFSTTTITEGVNTTAKNIIIYSHKKGIKDLKKFDVLNIIGRAGRFYQHFSGRVFIIDEEINAILDSNDDVLKHKNYGKETSKSDLDYAITKDEYLSKTQLSRREEIQSDYDENSIPLKIQQSFLTILPKEKIKLYKLITFAMDKFPHHIPGVIKSINSRAVSLDQVELLMSLIHRVIGENDKLYPLTLKRDNSYSILSYQLMKYLIAGYPGLLIFELDRNVNIDIAVRKVSNVVYNIFRYELAKHIGIIDLIYRVIYSNKFSVSEDEVVGFSSLLSYLEYGTYSEKGRKASDFGVSHNILRFIENKKNNIDEYEKLVYADLSQIIEES